MSFINTYTAKFAEFKRQKSKGKGSQKFKSLSTEKKAALFMQQSGPELKKDLEKAVKKGEKINFKGLPNAAKRFFGQNAVREIKRGLYFTDIKKTDLVLTSGPNFAFNEGNALKSLENTIKDKNFIGPGFIVYNDVDIKRAFDIYNGIEESEEFGRIKTVFKNFIDIVDSGKYPFWNGYTYFDIPSGKFTIIISLNDN